MWLFHPRIAALRKTNYFFIKIEYHPDSEVSGRREGRILTVAEPPTSPLQSSVPANVIVEYDIKKKDETRIESLPVGSLAITRPKIKGRHAIISGPRTGDVVVYLRSEGADGVVLVLLSGYTAHCNTESASDRHHAMRSAVSLSLLSGAPYSHHTVTTMIIARRWLSGGLQSH